MGTLVSKREIIESLPTLTPEERGEVVNWCEALGAQGFVRGESRHLQTIYASLARLFAEYHADHTSPSLGRFARSHPADYKALVRAANHAVAKCAEWWPDINDIQRVKFLDYLCRVSFDAMSRQTHVSSWQNLIKSLTNLEASINEMFPGWLRTGDFQKRVLIRFMSEERRNNNAARAEVLSVRTK